MYVKACVVAIATAIAVVPVTGCASGTDASGAAAMNDPARGPGPGRKPVAAGQAPASLALADKSLAGVQRRELQAIDRQSLVAKEREAASAAQRPGPTRFAVGEDVSINLENAGTWQDVPGGRLWRLVLRAPQALSVNLLLSRFDMPEGAKLWLYDPSYQRIAGPYTARDRSPRGRLATALIESEEVVVELFAPAGAPLPAMEISSVNKGFRNLN